MTSLRQLLKPASSPSRSLRLLQLVAVFVLVGLVSTVAAAPAVTSATCANSAGYCADGATVEFKGTELTSTVTIGYSALEKAAITCTGSGPATTTYICLLTVASATKYRGEYPVYMSGTYVGNLLIGTFYEQDSLKASPFNNNGVESTYSVVSYSTTSPKSGEDWILYGTFNRYTTYDIVFFNNEQAAVASSTGVPTCQSVSVSSEDSSALVCKGLTTTAVNMGQYNVLVQDKGTNRYLPGSATRSSVVVYPPSATVSIATGGCADDSSKCVTGMTITFNAANVNTRTPVSGSSVTSYVSVRIGFEESTDNTRTIRCDVTQTASDSVTCRLRIGSLVVPGMYPVYMTNQVSISGLKAPEVYVGSMMYGTFPGWNPSGFNSTVQLPDDLNYQVTGVDAYTYDHADYPLIYGVFPHDTEFDVETYNLDTGLSDVDAPSCLNAKLVAAGKDTTLNSRLNAVTCWLKLKPETMGRFRFVVIDRHTGWVFPGSTTLDTFLVGRQPTVTNITGDCALDSTNCVTGAVLTFDGNHINTKKPSSKSGYDAYVHVSIGFNDTTEASKMITCEMTGTTGAWRSGTCACKLTIGSQVVPGMYPIYMSNIQTSDGVITPPKYVGALTYGTFPGFKTVGASSNIKLPDDLNYQVTGVDAYTYDHANYPLIYGVFPHDTEFDVETYNLDTGLSDVDAPSCLNAKLVAAGKDTTLNARLNAVTCWLKLKPETMGRFRFLVRDKHTGWIFPGSTTLDSFVVGRQPIVKNITGDCAEDSSKCVTGALLTFVGNHINTKKPSSKSGYEAYVSVKIGFDDTTESAKMIKCDMTHTTGEWQSGTCACKLTIGSLVVPGMYPIYMSNIQTSDGLMTEPTHVGNILYGTFPGWNPAGYSNAKLPDDLNYQVTSVDAETYDHGEYPLIYGVFPHDTEFEVKTYNLDTGLGDNLPAPNCLNPKLVAAGKDTTVSSRLNAVTCWLKLKPETMGRFRFIVIDKHTGWVFPGSTGLNPFLLSRYPNVESASGDCAEDSSKCVTGAIVTFKGDHINTRSPPFKSPYTAFVHVSVGFDTVTEASRKIQCDMTHSTGEWIEGTCACKLTIGSQVVPGMYPIYMSNLITSDGVKTTPKYVGSLLVGSFSGWKTPGYVLDTKTHMYNVTSIAPQHAPEGTTVTLFGNFNSAARYSVSFRHEDGISDKTPTCKVTATTDNTIRCTIHYNGANVRAEFYPMVLDVTTDTYLKTTFSDEHSVALDGDASKVTGGAGGPPQVATIATTIVFAVLFVLMVVLLIVLCCCCEMRRKTKRRYVYSQEQQAWANENGNRSLTEQVWEGCPMADMNQKGGGTQYQNNSGPNTQNNSNAAPPANQEVSLGRQ